MIQIGVLSDTHLLGGRGMALLADIRERHWPSIDLILHAGDMVDPDILNIFSPLPVHAVRGNMDPVVPGLPCKRIVGVGGKRIGLIHGWGAPHGIEDRVLAEFRGEGIDCLVYGHSHFPVCHEKNGILLFNPGSPTDPRRAPGPSVGLLEIDQHITGHILRIDSVPQV